MQRESRRLLLLLAKISSGSESRQALVQSEWSRRHPVATGQLRPAAGAAAIDLCWP
jgi:hypothetical protein